LTSARLMTLRGELSADGQKRLDRVLTGGARMQRALEQILDVARDHWGGGLAVSRTPPRDLLPLVAKIVAETRVTVVRPRIELRSEGCCRASVDADRFEQVVAQLLGNAIKYGEASRPVLVALVVEAGNVCLRVHNFGPPIAAELLPQLFDAPRLAARRTEEQSKAGLGLGLYIAERIVRAHGGTLRVTSSAEDGTLLEAAFPIAAEPPPGA
jgi:phosphoserine phosphatase RsbU/P